MKKLPFSFLSVFVLALLLLGACEQPAGSNPAWETAEAYKTAHAAILDKKIADLTADDEAAVNAALAGYQALSADSRALLGAEKALLDGFKARIETMEENQEAVGAFKTDHAAILDKTAASIMIADEAAVGAALEAYQALSAEAQALLGAEKALLDSLKARIDALVATQEAAEAFKTANAAILSKTEASVMTGDEGDVNAALGTYEALSADIQDLLTAEKGLLDKLKTKIELLKGGSPAQIAANAFKASHATTLSRTETSVLTGDEGAVDAALGAYEALEGETQALLAAEKALLDSLKTRIGALFEAQEAAEAYKTTHAAILAKTTAGLALADKAAVKGALTAYETLNVDARALLSAEKALLDSLEAGIDTLEATAFKTAHAAILGKTTAGLALADKTAVNGALTACEALDADVQALLTTEKALLDSLKLRIDALEEAGAFTTTHAAILAKTAAGLAVADKAAVNRALTAYEALGADAQALLAAEKARLDSLKLRIDTLEEAGAFTTTHAAILTKTVDTLAITDEAALNAALAAHGNLGEETQALLTGEKARLDSLKARIATLKAQAFTAAHAAILAKTADTLAITDQAALNAALTAYGNLGKEAQALLTGEKARLDSLKTGIDTLKAQAFATDHAAILAKTVDTVAITDEADVDAALIAYNALEGSVKALLAEEKRLLDSLKAQIEQLKGVEQEEFILLLSAEDMAMIGVDAAYPLEANYRLVSDIELSDWTPIGNAEEPFFGIFEGDNYKITITSFAESLFNDGKEQEPGLGLGIFGWTRGSPETPARVRNLTVRTELNHLARETDACYVGALVGYADEYTELSNITVEGFLDFTNKNTGDPQRPVFVGGIAGALIASELKNSDVSADITGSGLAGNGLYNYVGGMVGMFDRNQVEWGINPVPVPGAPFAGSSITNCRVTGDVRGWTEGSVTNIFVGGIAGGSFHGMKTYYSGKIEDCSSTGNVTASGGGYWSEAGGIAGFICGDGHDDPEAVSAGPSATGPTRIVRCYATGAIVAEGPSGSWPYVGGIVGNNYYGGLVSQCWFNGLVKAEGEGISDYTGGIAGYNSKQYNGHSSRIEDCWSDGQVEGYLNVGGIVGQNQVAAIVSRCYSRALVSVRAAKDAAGSDSQTGAGGIAGYNSVADARAGGTVQNCVALNPSITSSGGFELLHRVVGNGDGSHSNNFARQDMEIIIDGSPVPPGDKGANAKDGADCAAQPAQSVYQGLGWDFSSVWKMSGGYPVLHWQ